MKKQKKSSNFIIASLVLLTLAFLAIAGYGFAKYSKLFDGNASAQVAKWSFKVNGSDENAQTFNLVNTINPNTSVTTDHVAPGTSRIF